MVNTFLVDTDFRVSASKLDRTRLGKQRVEAYQILIVIRQYRFLAKYFNLPDFPVGIDTPKETRKAWVTQVIRTFKLSGLIGLHIRGGLVVQYFPGTKLPRRPESGNQLHYDTSNGTVYETKGVRQAIVAVGPWTDFVLPGDDLITTRIRINPVIDMWLGFEDALKDYINAHIETWLSRGYKNNMKTYTVPSNYLRPAWSYSEAVLDNFRSTLIEREIDRLEPIWYIKQNEFVDAWCTNKENNQALKKFAAALPTVQEYNNTLKAFEATLPLSGDKMYALKTFDNTLPKPQWWLYASREYLLTFGRFPGFIWP